MQRSRLFIVAIFLIMLTTFAYSALATNLSITGEANFRTVSDIRVTNIEYDSVENGAILSYESKYTKDTITNGFILPNANSSISYIVTITNKGTIDQAIYDLTTVLSSNNNMIILIDDMPINEALPMIVPFGTSKTIKITYKTTSPSNSVINIINQFTFKEVYYITYNLKGGTSNESDLINGQVKYKDVDLTLTDKRPTKSKYVFTGWTDEQNGEAVKYNAGSTYTLNENKTLYAIYRQGESTFLAGSTFNSKIKQLAGNTNATYETEDTNITSIVRANTLPNNFTPTEANIVSTADSDFPIYAWYSNGTIYYYTDVDNPFMNSNSSNMFRGLTNTTSIEINAIDTSRSTTMNSLFNNCNSLASINLSNFNTILVSEMDSMFENCSSLTSLTLNNFNTSNVLSMQSMFKNCSSLTSLDLSNFNLSNVTSITDVLNGMTVLKQLKTPSVYPSSLSITLPNEFYSTNNTSYQTLATGSPTEVWIKRPYTVVFNSNNGTGTMADQKIGVDATTTLTPNSFTRVGYTFVGWNTKADGTGTAYLNNASVTNLKTYDESITLYAQWTVNTYTIVFNKNDNDATGTMSNQTVTYDTTVQLNANQYLKTGYKFIGWNTKADGTGTTYQDGESVSNLIGSGIKTLYAMWQRVMAENIYHEEAELNCTDAQCVIDELYYMLY